MKKLVLTTALPTSVESTVEVAATATEEVTVQSTESIAAQAAAFVRPDFLTPAAKAEAWITDAQVTDTLDYIRKHSSREALYAQYGDTIKHFKMSVDYLAFMNPTVILDVLNSVAAMDDRLEIVVGKISDRLPTPKVLGEAICHLEFIKIQAAYQLIQALTERQLIIAREELDTVIDEESGKTSYRFVTKLTFGNSSALNTTKIYIRGVELQPGVVYQKQVRVKAGGRAVKLSAANKISLSKMSSFKLRIAPLTSLYFSDFLRAEQSYINVKLGLVKNLDIVVADALIKTQVQKLEMLQSLEAFYLPMWVDYRARNYYELKEYGLNPQGGGLAKYIYEAADSYQVSDRQRDAMKYSAVIIVEGNRMPHHQAVELFNSNPEYYLNALHEDVYTTRDSATEKDSIEVLDYGQMFYNKRLAEAIQAETTHFILFEDATNGGVQHGGLGFKSPKMAKAGNIGKYSIIQDAHQQFGNALGISRDKAKAFNQSILHGQTIEGMAKMLGKSVQEAKSMLIEAYGVEALNISAIANWGRQTHDNNNTALFWTTKDGFKVQSISFTESVANKVYAFSTKNKSGYSVVTVTKDMPMIKTIKGEPVYGKTRDKSTGIVDKKAGGDVKQQGTYANITHSIDGVYPRVIGAALLDAGVNAALFIHDNFGCVDRMDVVRHTYKQELIEEYEHSSYESALKQIVANHTGSKVPELELLMGTLTLEDVKASKYYLSA